MAWVPLKAEPWVFFFWRASKFDWIVFCTVCEIFTPSLMFDSRFFRKAVWDLFSQ